MKLLLAFVLCLFAVDSQAHEILVTQEMCDQMVEAIPDSDVAYKPDTTGEMGPPADLGGPLSIKLPKRVSIPINIDTSKYMGSLGNPPGSSLNAAEMGSVTFHDDGRIYYNGQPLFHEEEFAIKEACKKLKER
jgi:hypothetical protein